MRQPTRRPTRQPTHRPTNPPTRRPTVRPTNRPVTDNPTAFELCGFGSILYEQDLQGSDISTPVPLGGFTFVEQLELCAAACLAIPTCQSFCLNANMTPEQMTNIILAADGSNKLAALELRVWGSGGSHDEAMSREISQIRSLSRLSIQTET